MSELSGESRRLLEAIDGVGGPTSSQRALMKRALALTLSAPVAGAAAAKVAGAVNAAGAAQAATGTTSVGMTGQAGASGAAAGSSLSASASIAWAKLLALGILSTAVGAAATWQVLPERPQAPHHRAPGAAATTEAARHPSLERPAPPVADSTHSNEAQRQPEHAAAAPLPLAPQPRAAQAAPEGTSPVEPSPRSPAPALPSPAAPEVASQPEPPLLLAAAAPLGDVPAGSSPAPAAPSSAAQGPLLAVRAGEHRAAPARKKRVPLDSPGSDPRPSRLSPSGGEDAPLRRELGTVAGAMAALDAGRFGEALETVIRYRETFPTGALITEARVLEVLALCGLGRRDEAQRAAAAIGPNEANNPAVRRLARSCVDAARWKAQ